MPRKKYEDYTTQEKLEYNIDLFGTVQMIHESDKSAIYGLGVVKNKRYSLDFNAVMLKEKDFLECEQVFDEIYAPAGAFRKKHGDTDILSDFYSMKIGTRLHVRNKVKSLLKKQKLNVTDEKKLDQYCKAYILYAMTTETEKVVYNPGLFTESGYHFTPKKILGLRVLRNDGGSQLNMPVMVSGLSNLVHKFDKHGNDYQTYVLKKDDQVKKMDVDIFDKYSQGYTFEWPEQDKYSNDMFDEDALDFDIFPEDNIEDLELENLGNGSDNPFEENRNPGDVRIGNIDEEDERDEDLVDHLQDDVVEKKEPENQNVIINNNSNNINNDNDDVFNIDDDDFNFDDIPDIDEGGNRISDVLDDKNKKIRRITDEKTLADIEFLVRTLKETSVPFEMKDSEEYGEEIEKLFDDANDVDVKPEEEVALGAELLALHFDMKKALDKIYQSHPERFTYDKETVSLKEAYKLNANLLADNLGKHQTAVFEKYISNSFKRIAELDKRPEIDDNTRTILSDEFAKALYLGKLRHEFSKVHGSPEEIKAWKESILNEVISDEFENNYKKVKDSDIFKRVMAEYAKANLAKVDSIRRFFGETLLGIAEEKYNEVYKYFAEGAKTAEEKVEVERIAQELDEIRSIGITVQADNGDKTFGAFKDHMYFDTAFIKKKANLYGKQRDMANELIQEKKEVRDFHRRRREVLKAERDKLVEEYNEGQKFLKDKEEIYRLIDRENHYNRKIKETKEQIDKLDVSKKEDIENTTALNLTINRFVSGLTDTLNAQKDFKLDLPGEKDYYITERAKINKKAGRIQKDLAELKGKIYQSEAEKEEYRKNHEREEEEKLVDTLKEEEEEYRSALEKNDTLKISSIRYRRLARDRQEKIKNPDLYEQHAEFNLKEANYGSYFSRDYSAAKSKIISVYGKYKDAYGINDAGLDAEFVQSIKDNDAKELEYSKNIVVRPERPQFHLNTYAEVIDPVIHIEGVAPLQDIIGFREAENDALNNAINYMDPYGCVEAAINSMKARKSVFYGSDEYDRIYNNLNNLKERLSGDIAPNEIKSVAQDFKKIITELGEYTDRKLDERDSRAARNRTEKTNSRNRRQAAETSKNYLESGLVAFKTLNNMLGRDDIVEEVKSDIAVVKELTKKNIPEFDTVINQLEQENKYDAINTLLGYLAKNRDKYMTADHSYNFRLNENENGKKRIPENKDERVYKTMLKAAEKLINSQMKYLKENDPRHLPNFRYNMSHLSGSEEINGRSVAECFGININMPEDEPVAVKRTNLADYAKEFENNYRILANKKKYEAVSKKLYDPGHYLVNAVLDAQENDIMIESALSALYLKDLAMRNPDQEFDFNRIDTDRRKFITILKESSFYNKLRENNAGYMDLTDIPVADVKEFAAVKMKAIGTPEKFNKSIIAGAITETISAEIKDVIGLINSPDYTNEAIQEKMGKIDTNLKIVKALGLEDTLNKAHNIMNFEGIIKGQNLGETVKNIKNQIRDRYEVRKMQAPKGVKL